MQLGVFVSTTGGCTKGQVRRGHPHQPPSLRCNPLGPSPSTQKIATAPTLQLHGENDKDFDLVHEWRDLDT